MHTHEADRTAILRYFGATPLVAEELIAYDRSGFDRSPLDAVAGFPLPDEASVDEWARYADFLDRHADFRQLAPQLVELNFPIEDGISGREAYRAVTGRGAAPQNFEAATGLVLERPHGCRIENHQTWAGRIPLIHADARADFVALLRALANRNEPVAVPDSMGASIVSGYHNWARYHALRYRLRREGCDQAGIRAFMAAHKHLYQDRFVLLSSGDYSGVGSSLVGLPDAEWRQLSVRIRAEHECTHYWTRRVLSSMHNRVLDEVIADYCGIVAAAGCFRADWLLLFFGLEHHPEFRESGRLYNYRGTPPLSDAAFEILRAVVVAAAENLARFDRDCSPILRCGTGTLAAMVTLTAFTLEQLASNGAPRVLAAELRRSAERCERWVARQMAANNEGR